MLITQEPIQKPRPSYTRLHRRKKNVAMVSWAGGRLRQWFGGDASTTILIVLVFLLPTCSVSAFSRRHGLAAALMEVGAVLLLAFRLWQTPRLPSVTAWSGSGPTPWLLAVLVWNGISAVAAADKRLALSEILPMGAGVIVYCALRQDADSSRIRSLLDALIGALLFVSVIAILAAAVSSGQSMSGLADQNRHFVLNAATHLGRVHTQAGWAASLPNAPASFLQVSFLLFWLPLLIAAACSPTNLKRRFGAGMTALAAAGALMLTGASASERIDIATGLLRLQQTNWVEVLLWAAVLAAFGITGVSALRRLSKKSLRFNLLVGAMAGVALQTADALFGSTRQQEPASFSLWLLLGLGMACAALPIPELPGTPFREALCRPWGRVRLAGICLLAMLLMALIVWTLPILSGKWE